MKQGFCYTLTQVSQLLQVSPRTVKRIVARGELVPFKVGRAVRVSHDELVRFTMGSPPPKKPRARFSPETEEFIRRNWGEGAVERWSR